MANITFSEDSGVVDSIYGNSQAPIRSFIEKRAEAFEDRSMIPLLFAEEKSTHWKEKYGSMTAMDGFKAVGKGGAVPTAGMQESYSQEIENVTWKNSFSIERELMEDAVLFDLKKKPQAFTDGYYRTREEFASRLFGEAIANAKASPASSFTVDTAVISIKSADGVNLFSKAHPRKTKTSVTQSNWFSDSFSADALAAAETAMQNFTGDSGELLNVVPDTILIPNDYALKKAVFAAIGADKDPATANNGFNFLFGRWNVIVNPYLNRFITANTSPWVLLSSQYNRDYGGAIFQDRSPLDVRSYIDEATHANVWTGYARFAAGFNDWRFAAVGGMTGGTALIASA